MSVQGRTITEEQWEQFLDILKEDGATITVCCEKTGIDPTTYYRKRREDKVFMERADEIIDQFGLKRTEAKLSNAIEQGNIAAIIFYLKCRSPRWRPWSGTEVKGTVQVGIDEEKKTADIINKLPDDIRKRVVQAITEPTEGSIEQKPQ